MANDDSTPEVNRVGGPLVTIQDRINELTSDDDLSFEEFEAYLNLVGKKFVNFYRENMAKHPEEFTSAKTKGEWVEEFNAYIDTLDGENES